MFERVGVIEGQRQRKLNEFFRDAGGARDAERRNTGTSFHQEGVRVSVIAALAFYNVLALGVSTSQSNGGHGRFRPRIDEPDFLHMRERGQHDFSQVSLGGSGGAKAGAVAGGVHNRFDHFGGSVPENEWTPRAHVVDVLVAIGVEDMGTLPAHNEGRVSAYGTKGTHWRIDAAGNHLLGAFLQLARHLRFAGHGRSGRKLDIYGNSGERRPAARGSGARLRGKEKQRNSPDIYNLATVLKHVLGILFSVHTP